MEPTARARRIVTFALSGAGWLLVAFAVLILTVLALDWLGLDRELIKVALLGPTLFFVYRIGVKRAFAGAAVLAAVAYPVILFILSPSFERLSQDLCRQPPRLVAFLCN